MLAAVLVAVLGRADEPVWGHRGALGLTVSAGGEFLTVIAPTGQGDNGLRAPLELGGTLSLTDHTELLLAGRVAPPGPRPEWAAFAGIRNSRGDRVKTFFDLLLAATLSPVWTLGFRLGLGVQYELLPVMGAYAVAGVQGGFGAGLRLSFELLLGLQFRTYLFQ
jgi:hypothetical protein